MVEPPIVDLIGRNYALLRRAAATWAYTSLLSDAAEEAILEASAAQFRARDLLCRRQAAAPLNRSGTPNRSPRISG